MASLLLQMDDKEENESMRIQKGIFVIYMKIDEKVACKSIEMAGCQ